MSAEKTPLPAPETFDYKHVGGRFVGICGVAAISLVLALLLGIHDPKQFAFPGSFRDASFSPC